MTSVTSPGPTGPLLVRVRAVMPALAPAEQRVANAVLADPGGVAAMTISELAEVASTSETTVIRFCKQLGVPGYPQLRLQLAAQSAQENIRPEVGGDIEPGDSLADVVGKVAFADERAVRETAQQLDVDALSKVVAAVAKAPRVDLYGAAASSFVALDLQQKLHRIRRVAFAWSDVHVMLTSAALLGEDDVAIGISHTGTTVEVVEALEEAAKHGATTVAVTNFPRSPLARTADLVLTTAARETTYRSGAMSSRIAQLMVVDCLFIGVAQSVLPDARKALEETATAVRGHRLKSSVNDQQN
ncbi:RpiR family transcriptional regulator [Kribbella orskensis]|uniref:RpiR family transcriptional regulator n=1 Tax=Kribbella orskensis TaxID=2512216 RepID=A0ABY2BHW9_9ACTN|nr:MULTISPECIES: MurR/RpiR family transcriptional regulator [Kribbella]TCN38716.1 RpiR family transcriptional regulator [Kribbella sp. VKM Ac-2500]TCO20897.1 RpiR family transcriptional regulator [Kribbella orskensis]